MRPSLETMFHERGVHVVCAASQLFETIDRAGGRETYVEEKVELLGEWSGYPWGRGSETRVKPGRKVVFESEPFEGMLAMAKNIHPREFIALLRGEINREETRIKELLLAPLSVYGVGFSNFNPYVLPFDASVVGLAHSHPSGRAEMSTWDYNHFYGSVMVVAAYPYGGTRDVEAFDGRGNRLLIVVKSRS